MKLKKTLYILLLIFAISAQAQNITTNHIIVIDNSGSMRGKPSFSHNLNIWNDVKTAIIKYIHTIKTGNKITLYNFDDELSNSKEITINTESDRIKAINYVINLKADGLTTCLYTALYNTLNNIIDSNKNEKKLIYVFTDFVEACPDESYTINNIKETFKVVNSNDYTYLYYISLGKKIPDGIKEFANTTNNVVATEKLPGKEKIFPTIHFADSINVDFSISRKVLVSLPLSTTEELNTLDLDVKFVCNDAHIHLLSKKLLRSNKLSLKFQVDNSYYSDENKEGSILLKTTSDIKLFKDKISVKFILPKRRISTIKIE